MYLTLDTMGPGSKRKRPSLWIYPCTSRLVLGCWEMGTTGFQLECTWFLLDAELPLPVRRTNLGRFHAPALDKDIELSIRKYMKRSANRWRENISGIRSVSHHRKIETGVSRERHIGSKASTIITSYVPLAAQVKNIDPATVRKMHIYMYENIFQMKKLS